MLAFLFTILLEQKQLAPSINHLPVSDKLPSLFIRTKPPQHTITYRHLFGPIFGPPPEIYRQHCNLYLYCCITPFHPNYKMALIISLFFLATFLFSKFSSLIDRLIGQRRILCRTWRGLAIKLILSIKTSPRK